MELLVLIIAWLLKTWFLPILVLTGMAIRYNKAGWQGILDYSEDCAVAIDKLGNFIGGPVWNAILKNSGVHEFGNWNETISYALAVNWRKYNLTKAGKALAWVLEFVDKGHLDKAILNHVKKFS